MVIAEVALSIVPLVAAGLMVRTFVNLTHVDVGFDATNIVSAKMPFRFRSFQEPADRFRLHRAAFDNLRQIPGVEDVSGGGPVPFSDWRVTRVYGREGEALDSRATMQSVLPGYLRVTDTRLVAGREFTDDDIVNERQVVVVDERIATQLWPEGAIGKRLAYPRGRGSISLEVIGVSEPVRVTRVRDDAMPHMFIPFHMFAIEQGLVIRTTHDAAVIAPAVKAAVESLGTRRPVYDVKPLQSYIDATMGDARFMMLVLMGFGVASVLLAAVGLYGTLAYLTSLRTQEFGIRMALGASAGQVVRAVASEGLMLAGIGAALGFAGAAATTGALQGLLYNVTPFDGVTLIGAVAVVAATALIAASHPAWRAANISPMRVLREGE
jgi:putative ABC transport system permease protein